jgi:hypothetical protein
MSQPATSAFCSIKQLDDGRAGLGLASVRRFRDELAKLGLRELLAPDAAGL